MSLPIDPSRKEVISIPGSNYSATITRDASQSHSNSSSSSSSISTFSSPTVRVDLSGLKLDGKSIELSADPYRTSFSFASIKRDSGSIPQSMASVSGSSSSGSVVKTNAVVKERLESTTVPSKSTGLVFGFKPYTVRVAKPDDDGDGVTILFGTDPNLNVSYEEGNILINYYENKHTITASLGNYAIVGKPSTKEVLVKFPNGTKQVFRPSTE